MSAYLGVDSDYWEAEVSPEGADTPTQVNARSAEGGDPAKEVGKVRSQNAGETQVAGAFGETVLIVDDEPVA